jgi:CRP-like cAMP-binding protein
LKKGRASVFAKGPAGPTPAGELKPGDFFGEISLLESVTSNATIKAAEDGTEILSLAHDVFQQLLRMNPQLEMLLRSRIEARRQQQRAAAGGK